MTADSVADKGGLREINFQISFNYWFQFESGYPVAEHVANAISNISWLWKLEINLQARRVKAESQNEENELVFV
jgi:hypothetical protein